MAYMESVKPEEIRHLDDKDRQILNILARNSREKLVKIAKEIGLSVDSTKKRVEKLEKDGVIRHYTIQPDIGRIGLPIATHIYLKLKPSTRQRYEEFIAAMKKNPRVIDLMSVLGDYDLYIVLIAKDTLELDRMKREIKEKFADLIGDWKEVLVTEVYKLEEYRF
jgi:Lrp/AsnC family leucine-responsive transcriptional regulator